MKVADRLNAAKKHIESGNFAEARKINASILAARPQNTAALLQASRLEGLSGRYRLAREYALKALASRTGHESGGAAFLLRRLQAFNLGGEAMALIDVLEATPGIAPPLYDAIGTVLNQLNQPERALQAIDKGLALAPDAIELKLTRAHTLVFLGRFDEAEREMDACMRRVPEIGFGWWTLSRLRKQRPDANHVDALRAQISQSGHNPANLAFLAYALHKELDDLGDYEGATKALDMACRAKRSQLNYSDAESAQLFAKLRAMTVRSTIQSEAGTRTPIFIVGMHRSGTTLLEQMLDGHSKVRGLGELYEFTAQMRLATDHWCKGVVDATLIERAQSLDYAAIGKGYLDSVAWRCGQEPYFVDKLPSNFLNIGFICQALPQAKILHMVRDPMESCFSNLRELFSDNTNQYSYNQNELATFFAAYEGLMAHWHRAFPGRIHDVSYSALTRDPETTLRTASAFCGLDFEPDMLALEASSRGVTTASAVQVRQGVVALDKPRWAPYATYLAPLGDALRHARRQTWGAPSPRA